MTDLEHATDTTAPDSSRFAGLFTLEELVALTDGLNLPLPWFARSVLSSDAHAGANDALAVLGRSSLVARGFVRRSGDGFATSPALLQLAQILAKPLLAVGVARVLNDRVHIWSFVARPEAAVGHALSDLGTHRLSMFPLTDLLPVVVEASGLRRAESSGAKGVALHTELIERMVSQDDVTTPVQPASMDGLVEAGFDASAAALVARLTEESESGSVVTVLRPDLGRSVVGTVTAWIDAGDGGLWSVDEGSLEDDDISAGISTVRLDPVSGGAILASIMDGLPSAD